MTNVADDLDTLRAELGSALPGWEGLEEAAHRLRVAALHARAAGERLSRKDSAEEKAGNRWRRTFASLVLESFHTGNSFNPRGSFVYVLAADSGRPLYVGLSRNVIARVGSHLSAAPFRDEIGRVLFIRCRNAPAMENLERWLIERLAPSHNVRGVQR